MGGLVNTVNNTVNNVVQGVTGNLLGAQRQAAANADPVIPLPVPPAGERAATVYTNTGINLGGSSVIPAETSLCDTGAHLYSEPAAPPAIADGSCIPGIDASPLAVVNLLQDKTTNFAKTGAPTTKSDSMVAGVQVLPGAAPGGVDVIDVRVAESHTTATCTPAGSTASSSIAFLSVAGNTVLDLSTNPGAMGPDNMVIDLTVAQVVLNFHHTAAGYAQAAPVVVIFPPTGPLAALITGTVFVSYTQSQLAPSDCVPPTPTPTPTPTGTPTPTPFLCADGSQPFDESDDVNVPPAEEDETGESPQHECDEEADEMSTPTPTATATPTPTPTATPTPTPTTCPEGDGENTNPSQNSEEDESGESAQHECDEESDENSTPTPTPTTCSEGAGENTNAAQNPEEDESGESASHECSEETSGPGGTEQTSTPDAGGDDSANTTGNSRSTGVQVQSDVQGQMGLAAIFCLLAISGLALTSRFILRRR